MSRFWTKWTTCLRSKTLKTKNCRKSCRNSFRTPTKWTSKRTSKCRRNWANWKTKQRSTCQTTSFPATLFSGPTRTGVRTWRLKSGPCKIYRPKSLMPWGCSASCQRTPICTSLSLSSLRIWAHSELRQKARFSNRGSWKCRGTSRSRRLMMKGSWGTKCGWRSKRRSFCNRSWVVLQIKLSLIRQICFKISLWFQILNLLHWIINFQQISNSLRSSLQTSILQLKMHRIMQGLAIQVMLMIWIQDPKHKILMTC